MGVVTGALGGVIRDIIINEVPLLFRKDLYAIASIMGGIMYYICDQFEVLIPYQEIIAVLTVIIIRIIAIKFNLQLPKLNLSESSD